MKIYFLLVLLVIGYASFSQIEKPEESDITHKGYSGYLELGYNIDTEGNFNHLKADLVNAYQFDPTFSFGLGLGYRGYNRGRVDTGVPVYGDFRFNFQKRRASPYFNFGIGYSLNASNDFEGLGMIIFGKFGGKIQANKTLILLNVGYELQQMNFFNIDNIGFGFGFNF